MEIKIHLLLWTVATFGTHVSTPKRIPFVNQISALILSNSSKENVFFSPIAAELSLGMLQMGLEGDMAEEVQRAIQVRHGSKTDTAEELNEKFNKSLYNVKSIKLANRIYIGNEYPIEPVFNELTTKYFDVETSNVPFNEATRQRINTWVKKRTDQNIKEYLPDIDSFKDNYALLVSGIYFENTWKTSFEKSSVESRYFDIDVRRGIRTDMMYARRNLIGGSIRNVAAYGLELHYSDNGVKMVIILPDDQEGLPKVESQLMKTNLLDIDKDFKSVPIELWLPKFKIDNKIYLRSYLENLGIKKIFTKGVNYEGLTISSENLFISDIVQQAVIDVNEKGLKKPTLGPPRDGSPRYDYRDLSVRHPFAFVIKDKNEVYFVGHVINFD